MKIKLVLLYILFWIVKLKWLNWLQYKHDWSVLRFISLVFFNITYFDNKIEENIGLKVSSVILNLLNYFYVNFMVVTVLITEN